MHRYERWAGDYVAGRLSWRRSQALEQHVQHCQACAGALEATRHRGSGATPAVPLPARPLNAQSLLGAHYSLPQERASGSRRSIGLVPLMVLLMVFALVGSIAGMSWLLGASPAQGAPKPDPAESWSASAQNLDTDALNQLRMAGWTCPVIETAGFSLSSASGTLTQGEATVTLVLSDADHTIRVAETRLLSGSKAVTLQKSMAAGATATTTDPTSGMLTALGHRLGAKAAAAVTYADGTATLNMEDVKYKVTTNMSKSDVEQILQRLVVGEHTRIVSLDPAAENISQRLLRGFSRLMVLDFQ